MNEREDKFLKDAFQKLLPEQEPGPDFNLLVSKKIADMRNPGMQLLDYLRILVPVLFISTVGFVLWLVFKGDVVVNPLLKLLPVLKPWHIFMAIIIIYFHFIQSVLVLAFLYLKNLFRGAGIMAK